MFRIAPIVLGFWCFATSADQTDPRLDELFQKLQQADQDEQGQIITQEIWKVWYESPDKEAKSLFERGVSLTDQADFRSALVTFTILTEMRPEFAEAWNRRATLLYLLGEYSASIKDIKRTLELEPRHFGAISGLGQIYMRQYKLQEARAAFEEALKINPHLPGARMNIIQINKLLSKNSI